MSTKAHVTFKGDAICGADLTGKSPDGLPSCQDCLGIMFHWLAAHDIDTAHAVALEREAIAKYLEHVAVTERKLGMGQREPVWRRHEERAMANEWFATQIRNGVHNEEKP